MSKSAPVSKEAYDSLKELMKSGQLSSVLAQVKDEVDAELDAAFEPSSYGSMHDGSKRRLCSNESARDHGFEMVNASSGPMPSSTTVHHAMGMSEKHQKPIPPGKASGKEKAVVLPNGISSLTEWGATICTLPKVKSQHLRYHEMLTMSHESKDMCSYLQWVRTSGISSAKVQDLKSYNVLYGGNEFHARPFVKQCDLSWHADRSRILRFLGV